jgi:hypothetical protein
MPYYNVLVIYTLFVIPFQILNVNKIHNSSIALLHGIKNSVFLLLHFIVYTFYATFADLFQVCLMFRFLLMEMENNALIV